MFTDSHCHLDSEYYDNLEDIIKSAQNNGVLKYISAADSIESCNKILRLSKLYDNLYVALGIHPENINDSLSEFTHILKDNLKNTKVVAIGEIGLDYYYGKEDKDKQIEVFEYQLGLAEEYNLPLVVHSRDATLDTIKSLKKFKVRGVIHCFSGSLETANEYIKMGFYIGVGGVMTFKNSKIDEVIKEIPLERIVLETDSPYLTPEPFRKYKNEPKYIKTIAEYLAKIKNIDLIKVSNITEKNIKDIFFI